jgi:hypothetical protein
MRTAGSERSFLKQTNATAKKRMLGRIPQRAPLTNFCMICESPRCSKYTHTRISAPVSGMTPIRPAVDGSLFAIAVAARMTATLRTILTINCIMSLFFPTGLFSRTDLLSV